MSDTTQRVPTSVKNDPSEVLEALDVARALWDKGEHGDAVRWVRRAADAANEAGMTARVATLARAAVELEEAAATPSQTRPASRPAAAPRSSATPPPLPSTRAPKAASVPPAAAASKHAENRIRVSVRISVRDSNLLVVRALHDGDALPAGTREAFLVMPEPVAKKGNIA
jgi:hypothetical protein